MSAVEFEVSLDALTEAMNCSWPKSAGELIGADGHAADGEETSDARQQVARTIAGQARRSAVRSDRHTHTHSHQQHQL